MFCRCMEMYFIASLVRFDISFNCLIPQVGPDALLLYVLCSFSQNECGVCFYFCVSFVIVQSGWLMGIQWVDGDTHT